MEDMDLNKLITTIQGLSDNENDLKQLKTQLNKFEEVLVKNSNLLEDALGTLDPNRHCLGWLYFLYVVWVIIFVFVLGGCYHYYIIGCPYLTCTFRSVRAAAQRLDPQRFISQAQIFLQNTNPQHIRLAPSRCTSFSNIYFVYARTLFQYYIFLCFCI